MRSPEQIDRILGKIEKLWKAHPDLRLTQLIGNCFPPGDLYNKEDEELERKLDRFIQKDATYEYQCQKCKTIYEIRHSIKRIQTFLIKKCT